jgi:hypothetical protein
MFPILKVILGVNSEGQLNKPKFVKKSKLKNNCCVDNLILRKGIVHLCSKRSFPVLIVPLLPRYIYIYIYIYHFRTDMLGVKLRPFTSLSLVNIFSL